jgi:hypothetical protein
MRWLSKAFDNHEIDCCLLLMIITLSIVGEKLIKIVRLVEAHPLSEMEKPPNPQILKLSSS